MAANSTVIGEGTSAANAEDNRLRDRLVFAPILPFNITTEFPLDGVLVDGEAIQDSDAHRVLFSTHKHSGLA